MICTLYIVTHQSGKSYIGWTSKLVEERWKEHRYTAKHNPRTYFHKALCKHSEIAFSWEIVQYFDTPEEAKQAEIFWIAELATNVRRGGFGYNETDGGEGITGYSHSEEARRKIGDATRHMGENHPMKSDDNRRKASERVKSLGDVHNMRQLEARVRQATRMRNKEVNPLLREDVRKATSARMKALGDLHPARNPEHHLKMVEGSKSADSLRKRSIANRGDKNPNAKLTLEDVEFIRASSLKDGELARRFGVSSSTISNIRRYKTWILRDEIILQNTTL